MHPHQNDEPQDDAVDSQPANPLPDDGMTVDDEAASGPALDLPEDPEEAVVALSAALMQARSNSDRYLDDYRRMAADFDNFRKRAQRDQADIVSRASERVLVNLLPVLDSFDMALGIDAETDAEQKMLSGMQSTHGQLLSIMAGEGLTPIPTVGEEFDPNIHEAVHMAEGSGTMYVTAEVRRGYLLGDRVLRAALVAVGYEEVTADA